MFCLHQMTAAENAPALLVTTMNEATGRVGMHGLSEALLDAQAAALQMPLRKIWLSPSPSMAAYEEAIRASCKALIAEGFEAVASGDLFLEDLRDYRVKLYEPLGLNVQFPIWQTDSLDLLRAFWSAGYQAVVICVDGSKLDASFAGRLLDEGFVRDLPAGVDPCGENGEFHSFVFDGPLFAQPVRWHSAGKVYKAFPAPVTQADGCFKEPEPPAGFWYEELV